MDPAPDRLACPICFGSIFSWETCFTYSCGHIVHVLCLLPRWDHTPRTACPYCRADWRVPTDDDRFREVAGPDADLPAAGDLSEDDSMSSSPRSGSAPDDAILLCCPRVVCIDGEFIQLEDCRMNWSEHVVQEVRHKEYVCHTCHRSVSRSSVEQRMAMAVDEVWWCDIHRRCYFSDLSSDDEGWVCMRGGDHDGDLPNYIEEHGIHMLEIRPDVQRQADHPIQVEDSDDEQAIDPDSAELASQIAEIGSRAENMDDLLQLEAIAQAAEDMSE
eukprot:5864238-Pyramimonas_sp.AAC.1